MPIPKALRRAALLLCAACALSACDAMREIRQAEVGDILAPQLASHVVQTSGSIVLAFSEPVRVKAGTLALDGEGGGASVAPEPGGAEYDATLRLAISGETVPGRRYSLALAVEDAAGNSLNIVMPFYGPNPAPAELIVNEILTAVSSKNRDCVELYVKKSGNLGGATVFWGVPGNYDYAYSLPPLQVKAGDYLLLHCKPEGLAEEIDELEGVAVSGGKNASPVARDFWLRDDPGLPDDTGIVSLADNPLGAVASALFYSDKTTAAGKDYRSFGSKKLLDRAEHLQSVAAWPCRGAQICVEDAARSEDMTATRSLNRSAAHGEGKGAADWHVVPSGQASLGGANSDEVYVKP